MSNDFQGGAQGLSQDRVALVQRLIQKQGGDAAQFRVVRVRRDGVRLPLSFAQERLWFLHQMDPASAAYNIPVVVRSSGAPLDLPLAQRAFDALIRRHEVLRTTFPAVDGQPVQAIASDGHVAINLVDLRSLHQPDRERALHQLVEQDTAAPFDLAQGPLIRATVVHLADDEHASIIVLHHIVFDWWSADVMSRELEALQAALTAGRASPLPDLSIQYADYAVSQRRWLRDDVLSGHLAYWKQRLAAVPTLELPTDGPRTPLPNEAGASESVTLSKSLSAALRSLSRREGATLFMTGLAAFKVLLARWTSETDIVVGCPVANRNRPELEHLIGFFVNMLALRTDLSGNPTFRDLLARVRQGALEAFAHQDLPFEKVVNELVPQRDLSRTPLFQVVFQLLKDVKRPRLGTGEDDPVQLDCRTVRFDLEAYVGQKGELLTAGFAYRTALFDAATIRRMLDHFVTLLEGIVADPERRIGELPLMGEAERRQIVVEWNRTRTEYPRETTVHGLFEEQVARTPEAVAVRFGERDVTYRELNMRANRLAHFLRRRGAGPNVLVGLCLGRSADMVVAMLGILKAGAAYVPLDPEYPRARLALMLRDTRAPVVLTERHMVSVLPPTEGQDGPAVICLDTDWPAIAEESPETPAAQVGGGDLAYVMYTSGSTGTPKGVCVPHRAISRLVMNTDYVQLSPADRVAQAATATFDAATFEIWGPLLHGGCVVGIAKEVVLSPGALAAVLREQRITVLFITTAVFNQLAREAPQVFSTLRCVLFGGEQVDPRWVSEVLQKGPPEQLLHVYGPTETTTFATWYRVVEVGEEALTVPIGRPIANTQVYALDGRMQPVPIGVAGELYIGGDGLAREYLHAPDLTAEKFVADPVGQAPGGRLYRTGDRVRWRADGTLEFLGRLDHQVKIRGFRIELGEVEAALREHPAVRDAVAVVREDVPGDKRLVAYLVADSDVPWNDVRSLLRERLPAYMVPSAFVVLDQLPLSPTGKVDRQALPEPDGRREVAAAYVAPRTETERQLAAIWREVLHVDQVGAHDDFFELGGHSLLATQVVSRIRSALEIELPLLSLFQSPTIDSLGRVIGKLEKTATRAPRYAPVSRAEWRLK